jgi:hypothetical protein
MRYRDSRPVADAPWTCVYSSQCLSDLWGSCFDITHLAQVLISGTE